MIPKPIAAVLTVVLLSSLSVRATAQNLFSGTWSVDQARSHLAGRTISLIHAEGDAWQLNADGMQYSFRVDGKNYRMASGELAAWTSTGPNTWKVTYSLPDGKVIETATWKLSPDGRILTVVTTGIKPAGQSFTDTESFTRKGEAADTGSLLGAWKSNSVKLSSPDELVIAEYGLGGLSIRVPAQKLSLLAAFDGKDVVPSGPQVAPGLTIALMRIGPSSFRMVQKINGVVVYSSRFEVSADGQTMTETGNSPGDPAQTIVWEKQ